MKSKKSVSSTPEKPSLRELFEDIRRIQAENPGTIISRDFYRSHTTFQAKDWGNYFGRFPEFHAASGLSAGPTQAKAIKPTKPEKKAPEPKKSPEPPKMVESDETIGDQRTIQLPGTRIHTLGQLVVHCDIDLDLWEVERFVCNKWEVGIKKGEGDSAHVAVEPLFQVKVFLKKHKDIEEANRIIERLEKKAEGYAPVYPQFPIINKNSGNIVEISPVDVHFGAQIWGRETGGDNYDLSIAANDYRKAVLNLITRTDAFRPEKALLIFGHDQQNSDNRAGMTEALTPQNNDGRYQKVSDASCDASIWAIDTCLEHYGQVEVIMVPGNHDTLSTWHLGRILNAWYRNVPQVVINNGPDPKKYWEYGVNMLLLTHGNKGKLENYDKTMAAEQPQMWGRTLWREAHTGDKHQRRLIEGPGATIRILPSLRPPCAWTSENHYMSIRAAEAYVWNKREGMVGLATHSILRGQAENE